ncbi:uncharacterized protein PRCAT00001067001 [Priceomyces carsonii]|uniref:uncharacterized protein n=1 Tax=Priceomyces carsonii TaxID=28549 RepID=UPI002ED86D07|nr:unnamed protein product [Priceomyces carsonii]
MVVNNPNNWHWVDKNCIDWSRKYFNEKLVGLSASSGNNNVSVSSVSSVEGDVEVCQRKGKVISLFDLKLTLNIEGSTAKSKEFNGSIIIPELAYDSTEDDLQFDINIYNEDSETEGMRSFIRSHLVPKLRDILSNFGSDLISIHSSDIQLASDKVNSTYTKGNQEKEKIPTIDAATTTKATSLAKQEQGAESKSATTSNAPKYNTSTLHLEPTFNTTAEQLYATLLDEARILAWTRSQVSIAKFPPPEKSTFKLFGGSVSGEFLKLVPNERILQLWRLEDWKTGHYAKLDIQLAQGAGETKMIVKWSGIPVGEEERVKENFENYYVRSIKITFGFGAVL